MRDSNGRGILQKKKKNNRTFPCSNSIEHWGLISLNVPLFDFICLMHSNEWKWSGFSNDFHYVKSGA